MLLEGVGYGDAPVESVADGVGSGGRVRLPLLDVESDGSGDEDREGNRGVALTLRVPLDEGETDKA